MKNTGFESRIWVDLGKLRGIGFRMQTLTLSGGLRKAGS